jgi:hypothetical protein
MRVAHGDGQAVVGDGGVAGRLRGRGDCVEALREHVARIARQRRVARGGQQAECRAIAASAYTEPLLVAFALPLAA